MNTRGGQTANLVCWSAAQRTTYMIPVADQRTDKNSGPALTDYRNRASTIPLFCIFWSISKNILRRRNYQIMGVDTDTDIAE
jgi:hypothetical protein